MEKTFLNPAVKAILIFTIILLTGILVIAVGNPFKKALTPTVTPSPVPQINAIAISADAKSILNAETKAVIFTIADTQKYLKDSGYFYNPDTFQTTNAKYEGGCFLSAALSNSKNRIVFSTGCLLGDLPQAWVGVYDIPDVCAPTAYPSGKCHPLEKNHFLIGGSGRNFVWSADDKTITYKADLGLSGTTETRTIDSRTGEILNKPTRKDQAVFRNMVASFKQEGNNNYIILLKDNKEVIVDKAKKWDDSLDFNSIDISSYAEFSQPKFSPKGNYLTYDAGGYEWSDARIYNIRSGEKVNLSLPFVDEYGFTEDEKYFYACANSQFAGEQYGKIYKLPEFTANYDLFKDNDNNGYLNFNCEYNKEKNIIKYILSGDESIPDKKNTKIVEYSFDTQKAADIK